MPQNPELSMTLDDAVAEVNAILYGLDLKLDPREDSYQVITRMLNRALREVALLQDWAYYADVEDAGIAREGDEAVDLRATLRPRIQTDDAVRLVDDEGRPLLWAYFLPRESLSKYRYQTELRCAVTRSTIQFSRPFRKQDDGLHIHVPVQREPRMFRLPELDESALDPDDVIPQVPDSVRNQQVDFDYPDLVVRRAAFLVAQFNPILQPRVQSLEAQFDELKYALMERDTNSTDQPFLNPVIVPIANTVYGQSGAGMFHGHPHAKGTIR